MTSEIDFVGILKLTVSPDQQTPQYVVAYDDIVSSAISIGARVVNVCINIALAIAYYESENYNYFAWTILCMIVPVIVTTAIQITM